MNLLFPLIPIAVIAGVFALIIKLSVKQSRRARENLGRLAQALGLPPPIAPASSKGFLSALALPSLTGVVRGRPMRVYNYSTGSGKSRVTWCAVSITVRNPGRLTLRVSRENVFTRIGRVFGVDDVATGDQAFDGQFYVKSNDAGYVRAAFIPEVRAQFTAAWTAGARGTITLEGDEIKYAEPGAFSSDQICARFPALADLAQVVGDIVEARGG